MPVCSRAVVATLCVVWCMAVPYVHAIGGASTYQFTLEPSTQQDSDVAVDAPLLASHHIEIERAFGLLPGGVVTVNASITEIDIPALSQLDVAGLMRLSPTVLASLETAGGRAWRSAMADLDSDSTKPLASNNISRFPSALSAIANRTFVYVRLFTSSTLEAALLSGGSLLHRTLCSTPYVASTRVPLRLRVHSQTQQVVIDAQAAATFTLSFPASDYVTLAVLQCSEVPVTVRYDYSLVNLGDVELSLADVPYLGLYSFQGAVYLFLWLFWTWYLGPFFIRDQFRRFSRRGGVTQSHEEGTCFGCSHTELLLWSIALLRTAQNLFLVSKNEITRRSEVRNPSTADRLDLAATAVDVVSLSCVLASMMAVSCGSGLMPWRPKLPSRQRATIVVIVAVYFILLAASAARYREDLLSTLSVATSVVYLLGLVYAVVQLRSVLELLRVQMLTATDPRVAMTFFRLHALRVPFVCNVLAVVAGWLLQALLFTEDDSSFLFDAVAEFRVEYWMLIATVFLRRTPVVF